LRVMGIFLPAMLILILLIKATKYAKAGSGQFGEAITVGAKLVTGLALGAATGGTAMLGRAAIGRSMASLSNAEGAVDRGKARIQYNKKLEEWSKKGKKQGQAKPTWEQHVKDYEDKNPGVKIKDSIAARLGGRINATQIKAGQTDHARHEVDEIKKKAGLEGVNDAQLSGVEKTKMEETFVKDKRSEIEGEIRRGYDSKGNKLKDEHGNEIESESDYKSRNRKIETAKVLSTPEEGDLEDKKEKRPTGRKDADGKDITEDVVVGKQLSKQGEKKVEDKLNSEFNEILRNTATQLGKQRFTHLQKESKEKVNMPTRIISRSTSGSYDVRNLSSMKADRREGLGTKATVGLIAAVATGMRMGFKKGTGMDVGSSQGSFLKDMGQTIAEALKQVKINVRVDNSGHGESHAPSAVHVYKA